MAEIAPMRANSSDCSKQSKRESRTVEGARSPHVFQSPSVTSVVERGAAEVTAAATTSVPSTHRIRTGRFSGTAAIRKWDVCDPVLTGPGRRHRTTLRRQDRSYSEKALWSRTGSLLASPGLIRICQRPGPIVSTTACGKLSRSPGASSTEKLNSELFIGYLSCHLFLL